MKKIQSNNIRIDVIMTVFLFGLHALIAFVFTPISYALYSDIILRETIAMDVVMTIIDILDTLAMSGGFALITVAVFMKKKLFGFIGIYTLAILFRLLSATLTTFIVNKAIDIYDIGGFLANFAAYMIIMLAALLLSVLIYKHDQKKKMLSDQSYALFTEKEEEVTDHKSLYPFTKLLNLKNSLQASIFASSLLLSIVKITTRVINLVIAIPDNILMTVSGFLCDILIFVITYAFSCFLLSTLYSANEKKKKKKNNTD